ncbi:fused response regulator/phosphatase [Mucilaginibacter sp. Bleaf8]|uniref:fused response regulator/phosphatase n=1 Tax=Mucilaginibacter sp. Bleaf8 TaxID=2834430 RepID=UPI001BCC23C7|nr:fused response regulator/phosphatase [Mucilaginibacter sp. Bleaf8]MBS7566249.1 fused response regulator/phosphatase [Mucilaginibacter sp. Bleaf8]
MAQIAKNILLVDDNPLYLKLLSQAFTKEGFACQTVLSAGEAINKLTSYTPDAILSDYEMPDMNGMEFRKQLLQLPAYQDIPFIFLTGNKDTQLMTAGLGLQAVDYVLKDTPVNVIVAKLNSLLNTVQKQRELSQQEIRRAAAALNIRVVPDKIPAMNGLQVDFWHKDYQDIPGGDFIDFIETDDRYAFILLGDIMGKRWKAWFFIFTFLSYIRAAIRFSILSGEHSTAVILQKVNYIVCHDDMLRDVLSSLSLLRVDRVTGQLFYAGAGDMPLLHYHAQSGELKQVNSSGLLLGMFADGSYDEQEIKLNSNDRLFIFTDGLTDYAAEEGKKSDYDSFALRLQQLLTYNPSFESLKQELVPKIETLVDDCTIIQIHKI